MTLPILTQTGLGSGAGFNWNTDDIRFMLIEAGTYSEGGGATDLDDPDIDTVTELLTRCTEATNAPRTALVGRTEVYVPATNVVEHRSAAVHQLTSIAAGQTADAVAIYVEGATDTDRLVLGVFDVATPAVFDGNNVNVNQPAAGYWFTTQNA